MLRRLLFAALLIALLPLLRWPRLSRASRGIVGLLWVLTLAIVLVSFAVKHSRFGLGLMAIREDEDAAQVMGVNSPRAKTAAFVISAFLPGIIGTLGQTMGRNGVNIANFTLGRSQKGKDAIWAATPDDHADSPTPAAMARPAVRNTVLLP